MLGLLNPEKGARMKSRSEIWLHVATDVAARCSVSTHQDMTTVLNRGTYEGDQFFTVTLPLYGKDFESALRNEHITDGLFHGYARRPFLLTPTGEHGQLLKPIVFKGRGLPLFLGQLMGRVFRDERAVSYSTMQELREEYPAEADLHHILREQYAVPYIRDDVPIEAGAEAVAAVRQLTLMFAKEKELCSDSAVEAALHDYEVVDKELELPFSTGE